MLISCRINFKEKIASDTEEYYEIKELTHWKHIMILNMCAPNNRASKYMNLKEVDKSTTIAWDSSTPSQQLIELDRKSVKTWKNKQQDLNEIYRTC